MIDRGMARGTFRAAALTAVLAAALVLLASCTAGPDYKRPVAPASAEFKELRNWRPSQPADGVDRGAWWAVYRDPVLDDLERQVATGNQSLKASEAAYRTAVALVQQARAGYFPTASVALGGTNRQTYAPAGTTVLSGGIPLAEGISTNNTTYTLQGTASWVPDFWGAVRRQVESDVAAAQASAAQLAVARLTLQAQLAGTYFQLRAQDSLQGLLDQAVAGYRRSLEIAQNQYRVGVAARGDVITAQTQLLTAQSQAIAVAAQRGQYEHALAVLTGKPPSALSIAPAPLTDAVPVVPPGLPSTLLERRPDIAQAERTMQQQNALIGVQAAAYFPTISITAAPSLLGDSLESLRNSAARLWTLAASGSELAYDAGARGAAVAGARAAYEGAVATYRQTVLAAFQSVEDALVTLRVLEPQAQVQAEAVRTARQAVDIALNSYRAGTQTYTAVVTAQAVALADEQAALTIQLSRLTASVALIQALGGGWDNGQLPTEEAIGRNGRGAPQSEPTEPAGLADQR